LAKIALAQAGGKLTGMLEKKGFVGRQENIQVEQTGDEDDEYQ
jgi:hypothetical protein